MKPDLAIAILTCDKYRDLWSPFFQMFFRNWPDCPYKIYLFSNEISYDDSCVKTILSGPDTDWSTSVKACLQQINEEYIMVIFDDVFLLEKVDQKRINKLLSYVEKFQPDYQKFTPDPKPDIRINQDIGKYLPQTHYRNGLMSIWKRKTLLNLIVPGESAWKFEIDGRLRSSVYENFFGVYRHYFNFLHGVEKGLWYRKAVAVLKENGVEVDLKARAAVSQNNYIRSQLSLLRRFIFINTPVGLRPHLFKISDFVRRKIYTKW